MNLLMTTGLSGDTSTAVVRQRVSWSVVDATNMPVLESTKEGRTSTCHRGGLGVNACLTWVRVSGEVVI